MECIDGVLRVLIVCHRDKCKAARFSGEFIHHQSDFADGACLSEEVLQVWFGKGEWKIAHVESVTHDD
jgi:hypothetical protein